MGWQLKTHPWSSLPNKFGKRKKRRRNKKIQLYKILFVACLLRNPSGTTEGIINSHVNLSPIKLLVKGSVSRNDKAQAHQSHAGRASVTGSTQAYPWFIALASRGSYGGGQKTFHFWKHWKWCKAQFHMRQRHCDFMTPDPDLFTFFFFLSR